MHAFYSRKKAYVRMIKANVEVLKDCEHLQNCTLFSPERNTLMIL